MEYGIAAIAKNMEKETSKQRQKYAVLGGQVITLSGGMLACQERTAPSSQRKPSEDLDARAIYSRT